MKSRGLNHTYLYFMKIWVASWFPETGPPLFDIAYQTKTYVGICNDSFKIINWWFLQWYWCNFVKGKNILRQIMFFGPSKYSICILEMDFEKMETFFESYFSSSALFYVYLCKFHRRGKRRNKSLYLSMYARECEVERNDTSK